MKKTTFGWSYDESPSGMDNITDVLECPGKADHSSLTAHSVTHSLALWHSIQPAARVDDGKTVSSFFT